MYLVRDDMYIGQGCPEGSLEFHVFVPYELLSCEAAIKSENRINSVMACCFIIPLSFVWFKFDHISVCIICTHAYCIMY